MKELFLFCVTKVVFVGNLYVVEARDYRNREDKLLCQGDIEREREGGRGGGYLGKGEEGRCSLRIARAPSICRGNALGKEKTETRGCNAALSDGAD